MYGSSRKRGATPVQDESEQPQRKITRHEDEAGLDIALPEQLAAQASRTPASVHVVIDSSSPANPLSTPQQAAKEREKAEIRLRLEEIKLERRLRELERE